MRELFGIRAVTAAVSGMAVWLLSRRNALPGRSKPAPIASVSRKRQGDPAYEIIGRSQGYRYAVSWRTLNDECTWSLAAFSGGKCVAFETFVHEPAGNPEELARRQAEIWIGMKSKAWRSGEPAVGSLQEEMGYRALLGSRVVCKACGWQGPGKSAAVRARSDSGERGVEKVCPSCGEYCGFIERPISALSIWRRL